jgi:transposase-like protein
MLAHGLRRVWPGSSVGRSGQSDHLSITQGRHGFQCHVARPLFRPLIVLFHQDRAPEAHDGLFVREYPRDVGASFDLTVQSFDRVGRMQLRPVGRGKVHISEYIILRLVHEGGELRQAGLHLVDHLAPLDPGGGFILLREDGAEVARRWQISSRQVFGWRRAARRDVRARSTKAAGSVAPGFVPIVADPVPLETVPHLEAAAPMIEIRLAGAVVRVGSGMDDHAQRRAVLRAVRATASRA